jgi:hypothetical protein
LAKEQVQNAQQSLPVEPQPAPQAEPLPVVVAEPAPSPALIQAHKTSTEEGVPPPAGEDQALYATVLLSHGLKIGTVENAEKEGPEYATEEECRLNLGPTHVGYYQAHGKFMRLKATTFGRDWAVGKPNKTVSKVIARAEKRPSKLETGLKVAAGVAAVGAVVVAGTAAIVAHKDLADAEHRLSMQEEELHAATERGAAFEEQANVSTREAEAAKEQAATLQEQANKSKQELEATKEHCAATLSAQKRQHEKQESQTAAELAKTKALATDYAAAFVQERALNDQILDALQAPQPQPQPEPAPAPVYIASYSSQTTYTNLSMGYGKCMSCLA